MLLAENVPYLAVRTSAWCLLTAAQAVYASGPASAEYLRALPAGLTIAASLFAFRDVFMVFLYAVGGLEIIVAASVGFAEGYLVLLLVVISTGYCTIQLAFEDIKTEVVWTSLLPLGYSVVRALLLIANIVLPGDSGVRVLSPTATAVLVLGFFAQFALLLAAWAFITFKSSQVYRTVSELKARCGAPLEGESRIGDVEAPADESDLTLAAQVVEYDGKLAFMSHFRVGVSFFMLSTIATQVLPVVLGYRTDDAGTAAALASNAVTFWADATLFVLVAFLGWTFRLRSESPYALVEGGQLQQTELYSHDILHQRSTSLQLTEIAPDGKTFVVVARAAVNGEAGKQSPGLHSPRLAVNGVREFHEELSLHAQDAGELAGSEFKLHDDE